MVMVSACTQKNLHLNEYCLENLDLFSCPSYDIACISLDLVLAICNDFYSTRLLHEENKDTCQRIKNS